MDLLIGFVNSSSLTNYFNHIRKRTKFQVVWFLSLSRFKKTRSQNWFPQNTFVSFFHSLFSISAVVLEMNLPSSLNEKSADPICGNLTHSAAWPLTDEKRSSISISCELFTILFSPWANSNFQYFLGNTCTTTPIVLFV